MLLKAKIYNTSIVVLVIIVIIGTCLWCWFEKKFSRQWNQIPKRVFHTIFMIGAIYCIYSCTLADRDVHNMIDSVRLFPFYPIIYREMYSEYLRTLFMNVLLFYPLGLIGVFSVADIIKNPTLVITMSGFFISLCIECLQYHWAIGIFEVDDLICNSFGAYLGTRVYLIYQFLSSDSDDNETLKR